MSRVFGVVWPRHGGAKATAQFAVLPFVSLALVMSAVDPWADFEVGPSSPLLVSRSSFTVIL
jgi:hypothetical protein